MHLMDILGRLYAPSIYNTSITQYTVIKIKMGIFVHIQGSVRSQASSRKFMQVPAGIKITSKICLMNHLAPSTHGPFYQYIKQTHETLQLFVKCMIIDVNYTTLNCYIVSFICFNLQIIHDMMSLSNIKILFSSTCCRYSFVQDHVNSDQDVCMNNERTIRITFIFIHTERL